MSPINMERLESGMRLAIKYSEAFNNHDVSAMIQLLSEECIFEHYEPGPAGTVYSGKSSISNFWERFFNQPDVGQLEIEDLFGVGFRCIMRWKYIKKNKFDQTDYIRGINIFEIRNGFIYAILSYIKG